MNTVTALSVLSNAVLVWNSVQFAEIVEGLEATTGKAVDHADLARISPLASPHVISRSCSRWRAPRSAMRFSPRCTRCGPSAAAP
jgi:hypothetical protein